jgi:hypothetical protein
LPAFAAPRPIVAAGRKPATTLFQRVDLDRAPAAGGPAARMTCLTAAQIEPLLGQTIVIVSLGSAPALPPARLS